MNVLLSFAQFEREVTGERIRDKIAASKKKGMWMGGYPPLGYDVKDRKLVVNEAEAETVRYIFRRYQELRSVRLLKEHLDAAGIVSKRRTAPDGRPYGGKPIARGALYLMLQNRIYRGEITHKDQAYPGEHSQSWTRFCGTGLRRSSPKIGSIAPPERLETFLSGRISNSAKNCSPTQNCIRHPKDRISRGIQPYRR